MTVGVSMHVKLHGGGGRSINAFKLIWRAINACNDVGGY